MSGIQLIFWFLLAEIFDVVSTYYAIKVLDLTEQNPIANSYFQSIGIDEFAGFKLALVATFSGLYFISLNYYKEWKWALEKSLQISNFGMWGVVALNILMILLVSGIT